MGFPCLEPNVSFSSWLHSLRYCAPLLCSPNCMHYTFFYDYVMAAAPSTRLHVLDALMSCSDLPSGSKAIIAPTAGNVTSLALSQLKRDPQYPHPLHHCPEATSLSMIGLRGGVKVWLSHLSGDRSEKSPLFGTPCVAGSGFP